MQKRKRRFRRIERLERQVQHHRAVLADRVEHHGPLALGDDFSHDVDALGFEALKMGEMLDGRRRARRGITTRSGGCGHRRTRRFPESDDLR